jgi:glycosyltransferase involved in cell wall biosynthesis
MTIRERFLTTSLYHRRKLRIAHAVRWPHLRGGWTDVTDFLDRELSCSDGVLTINALEATLMSGRVLSEPWVAFAHEVPQHHYDFPDLTRLQQLPTWKASIRKCCGLWVLSSHNKAYLDSCSYPFPISFVYYPITQPVENFSFEAFAAQTPRTLLCIGEYLRRLQPFFDLVAPGYQKIRLSSPDFRQDEAVEQKEQQVIEIDRVPDETYDRLLSNSVVFLNLIDAGANTTIVECISRGTPILVNRVGGVSEYLGDDYPLYYESTEEASAKLADMDLLEVASRYLQRAPVRQHLTFEQFGRSLENTAVYRTLPVPNSQRERFPRYDLTVLICTYRRIECLGGLLERLSRQQFDHSFEVIIWNNETAAREEVSATVESFSSTLSIRVFHSSENMYCAVRFAAPALMWSDRLMICDDDVLPEPGYLQKFWNKYQEYGPRCVVCARGNTFLPHIFDANKPDTAWREKKYIDFHDEAADDREVHFFHADNCLISRSLLKEAVQQQPNVPEYVLVDDYWLSYVISKFCRAPIWKIKADDVLRFHLSADDARIAMFQNSLVREQQVNFYIYHMLRGWPFPLSPPSGRDSEN